MELQKGAGFLIRLLYADLHSPTENWEDLLAQWGELAGMGIDTESFVGQANQSPFSRSIRERLQRARARDIRAWLEAKATGQKLPPEMSKEEFEDIVKYEVEKEGLKKIPPYREKDWDVKEPPELPRLREMQKAIKGALGGLLDPNYERGILRLDTIIRYRFDYDYLPPFPEKPNRIVEMVGRGDVVWRFLIPLLRQWPLPFARCAVCETIFARHGGRGKPRQYCSPKCKVKGVPSAATAKRTEYKRRQRHKQRAKEMRAVKRILRKAQFEHEQLEQLSKMEMFAHKSHRALVQSLNAAKREQTQIVKQEV